jgi:hypothetical protein
VILKVSKALRSPAKIRKSELSNTSQKSLTKMLKSSRSKTYPSGTQDNKIKGGMPEKAHKTIYEISNYETNFNNWKITNVMKLVEKECMKNAKSLLKSN